MKPANTTSRVRSPRSTQTARADSQTLTCSTTARRGLFTVVMRHVRIGGRGTLLDNPLPKLKDGSDYFVHDDFNVLAMSDFIQSQFTIWAQDAGIFIYDKKTGVYILGELEIDKAVRKELGILRKKRYTDEVLGGLACMLSEA